MSRKDDQLDDSQNSERSVGGSVFSDAHSLFAHRKQNRRSSLALSESLSAPDTKVYVVDGDDFGHVPLAKADFFSAAKLGVGGQSKVFAGMIDFGMGNSESLRRRVALKEVKIKNVCQLLQRKNAGEPIFITMHEKVTQSHASSTDHNMLKLLGYVESEGDVFAVFPYCGLFLSKFVKQPGEEVSHQKTVSPMLLLAESDPAAFLMVVLHVLFDQLNALRYLHSKGMVNRDVKPDNITYYDGHWCSTDLDDVVMIGSKCDFAGTPYYVHPYVYVNGEYNTQPGNSVYGLGQVLNLLLGRSLVEYRDQEDCQKAKRALYKDALRKKHEEDDGRGLPYPSLGEMLSDIKRNGGKLLDQLQKIADCMTHPLPERQPTVLEVIQAVEVMRAELKMLPDFQEVQNRVDAFYASKQNFGPYFREDVTSPLHRSLSVSGSGFFSASGRSIDSGTLDLESWGSVNSPRVDDSDSERSAEQRRDPFKKA